jgi:methyl-accepting chemotaxis protein
MDQATLQNAALVEQAATAAASMREHAGSLNRVIGAFVLGPEHARPSAQIHLIASNKGKPAADASPRARTAGGTLRAATPRKAPVVPARRAGAAKPDVDWEEF